MKILIITDAWHPQVNGVVRTYEHLIEELESLGHNINVISPADFSISMPMPGYSEIKLAIFPYHRLKKMIRKYAPDVIHVATEGPLGWAGRKYCIKRELHYTTSYHTQFPDYVAKRVAKFLPFLYNTAHRLAKHFIRTFHAHSTAMMIATQSLEDQLKIWGFKNPMHHLIRGANLDMFYPGEKTLFQDLPKPIALYVGRVAIEKNLEDFLGMEWAGSKIIVGDGPSLNILSRKYPDSHFVGTKIGADLAEHYRSADVFAFPSKTDTFGIVLIEALASGLPIAAYNVTGPRDIITEDFLGSLHENDLARAARQALKTGTPERRAEHVKNYYTWEHAGKQFEIGLKL